MLFILNCSDKVGATAIREANRAAHLEYLKTLGDRVILAGPMLSDDGAHMLGSILVIEFPDRSAAEAWSQGDPYAKAGLFDSVEIRAFRKVLP